MARSNLPGPREIRQLANAVVSADAELDAHPGDPEYQLLSKMALSRLYSDEWRANFTRLQAGDAEAVGPAIDFLEADPMCFRSGYTKERLCQYLARMDLNDEARARLAPIVTKVLVDRDRPERERKQWLRLSESLGVAT